MFIGLCAYDPGYYTRGDEPRIKAEDNKATVQKTVQRIDWEQG